MAAKTWYLTNNSVSVGSDMSETDPGAEAYRSPVTGWIVSTGSTNHSEWYNDTERAASTFTGTTVPDGSLDTTNGDFWVTDTTYSGTFANADWVVYFACRANTNGGAQDGQIRIRLFRGANQDGSSATEVTAAQQTGTAVTNLATSATQVSTVTFNPGSFSVTNEYIFIQLAWERTGAGGMTSSDVNARIGNGSGTGCRVVSASLAVAATLDAASGSYTLDGKAATLGHGRTMNAASGSYTYTGQAATMPRNKAFNAAAGSYTLTGIDIADIVARQMNAEPGTYTLTGFAATLEFLGGGTAYTMNAEPGSYTLTGIAISDIVGRVMNAASGSYTLTGAPVTGVKAMNMNAAAGSYTILGYDTTLTYTPAGGGGSVVIIYNQQAMAGGITLHKGVSRPNIALSDAGGGTYNVTKDYNESDFKSDSVSRETYLIDGELP